jgi:hypothetical protein
MLCGSYLTAAANKVFFPPIHMVEIDAPVLYHSITMED